MGLKQTLNKLAAGSALVVAALLVSAGVAHADGMAKTKAPPVVQQTPTTWSGLYFGVHSGWAWADVDSSFVSAAGVPTGASDSVTQGSQIVGGQLGLQHQFSNIVLGVEGGITTAFGYRYDGDVNCPNTARTCTKQFDDVVTVGGRLGWAAGHWMPYLAGGYASARFSHESFDKAPFPAGANTVVGGARTSGWYIGAGVDWMIAPNWTLGLEYRHYEFDNFLIQTSTLAGVPTGEFRTIDPSLDTVALRVSWKFDRPGRVVPLK